MPNRLASATSPYLLQHKDNPVDWYEWGPEAIRRAREENRPILLSIGYAACHWCHVMERESFENPRIARLMNENFVCIKVDREERPDVDAVYMEAVQAMTGQGGWPMTVFLTPDLEPFYAGTYFPPADRHGLPRLLMTLAELWRTRRSEIVEQGRKVASVIAQGGALGASGDPLTEDLMRGAEKALEQAFDAEWGGFSQAPKFPQPMTLELLLRCHLRGYPGALDMVVRTLDRMAAGGIHDQLGGGFHRYATDRRWLVPHFEKMLYDNAQLARLYLRTMQVAERPQYRRVLDVMRHPGGGFYSSQDADSEGVEGKFYTWSYAELAELGVAEWFGAEPDGNWEGVNILWHPQGLDAAERGRPDQAVLDDLRGRRARRVPPATDDKVVAAWNGLAISALAEASRVLGEPRWLAAAEAAAGFVLSEMRPGGRLARSWRDGRTSGPGFLDDHAGMAAACLDLWETTFEPLWIEAALELAHQAIRLFRDEQGGFFQTGSDTDPPLTRPKELFDNAVPSGNSLAAAVLQRLALLTGDRELERAGVDALRSVRRLLERAPAGFGAALCALDLYLGPEREVAIVGEPDQRRPLLEELWRRFRPRTVVAAAPPGTAPVALLEGRELAGGRAAAYVCERFACRLPVTDPADLERQLA